MDAKILQGDCLNIMPTLDADSVDSIITDPPYGLTFMGKEWDKGVPGEAFWREALRVAKPGAHLLAFGGTRTHHRLACAIEDAGWEIRDCVMWVYASGFPKSHNLKDEWSGWGTALKPAWEPIIVARKPLIGTVAANVLEHGTGGLNVDGCRVGTEIVKVVGPAEGGRWPANLIHDGSDEVVGLFPVVKAGVAVRRNGKSASAIWGSGNTEPAADMGYGDTGSAARFFYCAKASKRDRDEGCEGFEEKRAGAYGEFAGDGRGRQTEHQPAKNHHPTVKPTDLMRYLVRLVTPPGGVVLDPFTGSGSTGKAAMLEGFNFIGIELQLEYAQIAQARIEHAKQSATLKQ